MKLNQKNKVLIFGFALALYLCYAFAFSNTLDYYNKYSTQKELIASNINDPAVLQQLIAKEQQFDKILSQYTITASVSFQNELLKKLTQASNKYELKIIDFKEPHLFIEKDIKTYSYIFALEGSFNGMLLLLNNIENNTSLGYIKHITFTKKRNYKTNADYLVAEVILQKNESVKAASNK